MAKYLCVQRNMSRGQSSGGPSPAQMQDMYAKFDAWRQQFRDQLVDLGGKVGEGRVVGDGAADGPFVEVKELIGGYMIVSAESLDEAVAIAQACPGLVRPGSGVEVLEILTP